MRIGLIGCAAVSALWIAGSGLAMAQTAPAPNQPDNPQPPENTVILPKPSQSGQDPSMAKTPGSDAAPGVPEKAANPESTTNLAPDQQPVNNAKPSVAGEKVPSAQHDTAVHNKSVAEHDKQPTITHTFNFTDEQKRVVLAALAGDKAEKNVGIELQEATVLPRDVAIKAFPESVSQQMPWVGRYKYVKVGDKVAVVEPNLHYIALILQ